jgi:hypothetical protein
MARPPALERGTEVRSRRAELKRRVAAGDLDLERLLRGDAQEHDEAIALDITLTLNRRLALAEALGKETHA